MSFANIFCVVLNVVKCRNQIVYEMNGWLVLGREFESTRSKNDNVAV